jgi:hypothetical protein
MKKFLATMLTALVLCVSVQAADLTITAASVVPGVNAVIDKTRNAGATITAGQAVYLDTNNLWQLANAAGAAALRQAQGIALNSASSSQPLAVQTAGQITIGATVVVGKVYVLSGANAGGVAPSTDLVTGWYTNTLGIGISTTVIALQFQYGGVAVP